MKLFWTGTIWGFLAITVLLGVLHVLDDVFDAFGRGDWSASKTALSQQAPSPNRWREPRNTVNPSSHVGLVCEACIGCDSA